MNEADVKDRLPALVDERGRKRKYEPPKVLEEVGLTAISLFCPDPMLGPS